MCPESFSDSELTRARRIAQHDGQVATALAGAQHRGLFIQALACGPDLVDRYENGDNAYGRAIVTAAMDLRRIGVQSPLDAELLREAAAGYLDAYARADPPADWFVVGLRWARVPVRNAVAALDKARYTAGLGAPDGYELADYLDQHGRRSRGSSIVPASVWSALLAHSVDVVERRRLGAQAHRRSLFRLAAEFWRSSDSAPDDREAALLADLLERAGHLSEAERWLRCVAGNGDWHAQRRLVDFLLSQERSEDAVAYAHSVAEAGDREAASRLTGLVTATRVSDSDAGPETAPALTYEILAELDDPARMDEVRERVRQELVMLEECERSVRFLRPDLALLVGLLVKHGQSLKAVAALRAAYDRGQKHIGSLLAGVLADLDRIDEAIDTVAELSFDEDMGAPRKLAELVYAHSRVDQAVALLGEQALEFEDSLDELVGFLLRNQRADEALRFLTEAAARDHDHATLWLVVLLERRGSRQQATTTLQAAVDAGHNVFVTRLGRLLLESGDVVAARELIEDRVNQGETQATFALAQLFQRHNLASMAVDVLREEAESGSDASWKALLWFHLSHRDTTNVEETLRIAAADGSTAAEEALGRWTATHEMPTEYLHAANEAECRFRTDLGLQLEAVGRIDEALEELEIASRLSQHSARSQYFYKLCEHHRPDEQVRVLRELAEKGAQEDVYHLAIDMHQLGVLQETADRLQAWHPAPDRLDLTILFHLQSVANGPNAGLSVLERAADAGDRWAHRVLAPLKLRRELGTYRYPTTLSSPENTTRTIKALRLRAKAGNVASQALLASVLEEVSRLEQAAQWRRSVADIEPTSGERELAGFLERIGDREGSLSARLAAAEAGDYIAMRQMARMCEDTGQLGEASMWWRKAVECGDLTDTYRATGPDTWIWSDGVGGGGMDSGLARWHEKMGHLDEALWMRQRAGEQGAFEELVSFLQRTGQEEEAARLHAFGIEPGGETAEQW